MTSGRDDSQFEPSSEVIARYAVAFRWNDERLREVLRCFGPLQEAGQEKLVACLVEAFRRFESSGPNVRKITANAQARCIQNIRANSTKLLRALGIDMRRVDWHIFSELFVNHPAVARLGYVYDQQLRQDESAAVGQTVPFLLSLASIDTSHREDVGRFEAINAELHTTEKQIAAAILGLIWLHSKVENAAKWIEPRRKNKAGGATSSQTAKGLLRTDSIEIYVSMRREYPDVDGNHEVGLGGPLKRFVRSVASLFGVDVTDDEINNSWRDRLRRNQMGK